MCCNKFLPKKILLTKIHLISDFPFFTLQTEKKVNVPSLCKNTRSTLQVKEGTVGYKRLRNEQKVTYLEKFHEYKIQPPERNNRVQKSRFANHGRKTMTLNTEII